MAAWGSTRSTSSNCPQEATAVHKGGRARLRPRRQALRHPWRGTHGQRRPEHLRRAGKDLALQPRRQHPRRQSLRFQQSGAGRSGSRNPFGIAFSATGQLAVTNNGPTGDAGSPTTGFDTLVLSVARGQGLSVAELLRLQPSPRKPNVRNRSGRPRTGAARPRPSSPPARRSSTTPGLLEWPVISCSAPSTAVWRS